MPYENMVTISCRQYEDLVKRATRYDLIRGSIIDNIRSGNTNNIVNPLVIRVITETTCTEDFLSIQIVGKPEEDDGK